MKIIDVFVLVLCIIGGIFCVAMLSVYRHAHRPPVDVSKRPSDWWTDSYESKSPGYTHVGIVRVARDNGEVLERRTLETIKDDNPRYEELFDIAMDRAYKIQRIANVHLNRR